MTNPPASTHAPAPASGPSNANSADPSRGVPYYEKLRRDLRETLQKKRVLDKNLVGEVMIISEWERVPLLPCPLISLSLSLSHIATSKGSLSTGYISALNWSHLGGKNDDMTNWID